MSEKTRQITFTQEDMHSYLRQIYVKSTHSVLPRFRLRQILNFEENERLLQVSTDFCQSSFVIPSKGCHIVGFGKAVIGMAAEIQRILGPDRIQNLILSVPHGICDTMIASGHSDFLPKPQNGLKVFEGAKNNIPDEKSLEASQEIENLVKSLDQNDLLFVLVSGGGSALLPSPIAPLNLEDKAKITKNLSKAGATIQELNAVRIQLSNLKGGKLGHLAKPAQVVCLILSDIIGDPLELISSGPTVLMPELPKAQEILLKYNIPVEDKVKSVLEKSQKFKIEHLNNVTNVLIGSNNIALDVCSDLANLKGYKVFQLTSELTGEAKLVGSWFAQLLFQLCHENPDVSKIRDLFIKLKTNDENIAEKVMEDLKANNPICLLAGGETTVEVRGPGVGGRNQEMALSVMIEYHLLKSQQKDAKERAKMSFLSAGTDGIDGPTEAAGAVVDQDSCVQARSLGLDPLVFLQNNDSNTFFKFLNNGQNLIVTGHTGAL